jgi:arabinofuranan 3-O-arabinosyltransferase
VIEAPEATRGGVPPSRQPGELDERLRQRIRLLALSMLLAMLAFVTAPGRIIADTKLDLAVDPGHFLARALTLWDPQQFGQLQDQAVGYLFPMGPFFYLGHLAGLPPWVVQRLWIAAVVITPFVGTVRLAERLGIGTPWTRIAAGLAYAISPAGLTLLGDLSAEFLPAAMLPWILLPLVDAARGGHRGWAAARSATAVGLCGGTNAAATVAVLIPAALYVLTLPRQAPRWRILGWWAPAVAAATWWWSVPLVLLLRYGVSIIPYTESAAATTATTGLWQILRGTENWVGYLVVNGQPWWQLGYQLATGTLPTLLTGLGAGLGLAGLLRPRLPSRRFLLLVLLLGTMLIGAGHISSLGNPLAGGVDHLINGPLAAFRNVVKLDPLVRLPVVLGLAHLLATVRLPRLRTAAAVTTAVTIAAVALPASTSGLATTGSFQEIPSYWLAAAQWLNRHAGRQAVLVLPGSQFGQYLWGSPLDDALQPFTHINWVARSLSTVSTPGNTRLLDAIDQQVAAGSGSAGLAQVLARMGVRYVLVRNDLDRSTLAGDWPARVHDALADSPGITRVVSFGKPPVGTFIPDDAATNFDAPYAPVEIYRVARAQPVASVQPAAGALRVYGGPESLITLASEGLLGSRPVLINSDSPALPTAGSIITDSLRRRVRNFGELRTSYSPTLTARDPAQTFEVTSDYTEPGWQPYVSVARYQGIADVTASSSASDMTAIPGQWATGLLPYAAVDGDPRTRWESGSWNGPIGQWLQIRYTAPVDPGLIGVAFADSVAVGPPVAQVRVTTQAGAITQKVLQTGEMQALRVPPGMTRWLRITVTRLAYPPNPVLGSQAAITDIGSASRTIVAPTVPGASPAAYVLAKAQPWPSGCMLTSLRWVCSPALTTTTEEQYGFDHTFTDLAGGPVTVHGSAVLISQPLVTHYVRLNPALPTVTASTTYTRDPQDRPPAAMDGNPKTAWVASPLNAHPSLTIRWHTRLKVSWVRIQRPPSAGGLLQVQVFGSRGQESGGQVGADGVLRFAPMQTNTLTLKFTPLLTPLQISEVTIPGVPPDAPPNWPLRLPCGLGPALDINGRVVPTRVTGTDADLLTGQPVSFTACVPVQLRPGANRVIEPSSDSFSIQDVVVDASALPAVTQARGTKVSIRTWTPSTRVIAVSAPAPSFLVVNENYNTGWQAVLGGAQLRPVRVDGWKQGWLLPAGSAGRVIITYRPDKVYRTSIAAGLSLMALVIFLALRPWVRPARRRSRQAEAEPTGAATPQPSPAQGRLPRRLGLWWRSQRWYGWLLLLGPQLRRLQRRAGRRASPVRSHTVWGCLLTLAGFWLGGWPGAVILPAVTAIFLTVPSPRQPPYWRDLSHPALLPGLLMLASVAGLAGEYLLRAGHSGALADGLISGVPQVLCLIILARLAAAVISPPPEGDAVAAGPEDPAGQPAG